MISYLHDDFCLQLLCTKKHCPLDDYNYVPFYQITFSVILRKLILDETAIYFYVLEIALFVGSNILIFVVSPFFR